jgi:hypothetical protein
MLVSDNAITTLQTFIDRQNDYASQNKKSRSATHQPTQIKAHFILPYTQSVIFGIALNNKWH